MSAWALGSRLQLVSFKASRKRSTDGLCFTPSAVNRSNLALANLIGRLILRLDLDAMQDDGQLYLQSTFGDILALVDLVRQPVSDPCLFLPVPPPPPSPSGPSTFPYMHPRVQTSDPCSAAAPVNEGRQCRCIWYIIWLGLAFAILSAQLILIWTYRLPAYLVSGGASRTPFLEVRVPVAQADDVDEIHTRPDASERPLRYGPDEDRRNG